VPKTLSRVVPEFDFWKVKLGHDRLLPMRLLPYLLFGVSATFLVAALFLAAGAIRQDRRLRSHRDVCGVISLS